MTEQNPELNGKKEIEDLIEKSIDILGPAIVPEICMFKSLEAYKLGDYKASISLLEMAIGYIKEQKLELKSSINKVKPSQYGLRDDETIITITIDQKVVQKKLLGDFLELGKQGLDKDGKVGSRRGKLAVDMALEIDPNCQEAINLSQGYQEASQHYQG